MALVDTHVHLADMPLVGDLPGVLARARAAGVEAFVVPSGDEASSRAARDLAVRHPGEVFAAAGLHPWQVGTDGAPDLRWLETMLAEGGFVAVGETGLDDVIPRADLDAQERVFRTQAGMAREAGLPLIVHVRGAFERLVRVLESIGPGGPGGILHAFGGSAEIAARLRPLGFLRGVAGSVTRPEAVKVRAAVARTPLDSLVLETDAPYIGTRRRSKFLPSAQAQAMGFHRKLSPEPKPTRDDPTRTVEPADVADIRDAVAMLHEVAPGEVEARTSAAAQCLFRLGPMPSRAEGTVPAPAPNRR